MDLHKYMQEEREKFLENPRKGIENLIEAQKKSVPDYLELSIVKRNPIFIDLFKVLSKEYGSLIHSQFSKIPYNAFVEENSLIITSQRIAEAIASIEDWGKNQDSTNGVKIARSYSAYLELIWKKLKRIISLAGLNPRNQHLNIGKLKDILGTLEASESLRIEAIKELANSTLRNSIGHEDIVFHYPNLIIFNDSKDPTKIQEISRMTILELKEEIAKLTAVLGAMQVVENSFIVAKLEPLLYLPDDKISDFFKTGLISEEMDEIIRIKKERK